MKVMTGTIHNLIEGDLGEEIEQADQTVDFALDINRNGIGIILNGNENQNVYIEYRNGEVTIYVYANSDEPETFELGRPEHAELIEKSIVFNQDVTYAMLHNGSRLRSVYGKVLEGDDQNPVIIPNGTKATVIRYSNEGGLDFMVKTDQMMADPTMQGGYDIYHVRREWFDVDSDEQS